MKACFVMTVGEVFRPEISEAVFRVKDSLWLMRIYRFVIISSPFRRRDDLRRGCISENDTLEVR